MHLYEATFKFYQEINTNGSTRIDESLKCDDQCEELEIRIESVVGDLDTDGGFYVLKSKSGWSINDFSELEKLLNKIKNIKYD